jgi:SAM-dependent methyltransferase
MTMPDPHAAFSAVSDTSSARQGQLQSEAARALFGRRTARSDATHLVPYVRPGLRLIDFGCGQGSHSLEAASLVAPGSVVGIDLAGASIAQARAQADQLGIRNVVFHVADIHEAQFTGASFDEAHFSGVLAYQSDPLTTLNVAYRAVKPGGLVAAREPQKDGDWVGGPNREAIMLLNRLIGEDAFKSVAGDPFIARRLGTLLLASGLERVEVVPGHSPALSSVGAVANFFSARLADVAFT